MHAPASPVFVLLCASCLASAAVVNVEFKFTPFLGDPAKADHVETVPGHAQVLINNVPLPSSEITKRTVPVMFDEREIAPSVWVPIASLGATVRKGRNVIRLEFTPADPKLAYRAQLRWASVTDGEIRKEEPGHVTATNQTAEGVDDRLQVTGKVVFEREFTAEFAKDLPWHHYPPVTELTVADKQQLAAMLKARVDAFRPDFALVYGWLSATEGVHAAEMKQSKCLERAYEAGIRVTAPAVDEIEFTTTANPEVLLERKGHNPLFGALDPKRFERIEREQVQLCASIAMMFAYPSQLTVVWTPAGVWQLVQ